MPAASDIFSAPAGTPHSLLFLLARIRLNLLARALHAAPRVASPDAPAAALCSAAGGQERWLGDGCARLGLR